MVASRARHRAAQPDVQRAAAHRVVRRAVGPVRAARRAVRRGDPDHHLRRRHHGALPVRRHAAERADRGAAAGGIARGCSAAPGRAGSAPCCRSCSSSQLVWALQRLGARRFRRRPRGEPVTSVARIGIDAVPRLRVRVRSDVGADSGRDGRRRSSWRGRRSRDACLNRRSTRI